MTLVLELPKELEAGLTEEAAREGVPVEAYAIRLLSAARGTAPEEVLNGADLVAYWQRELAPVDSIDGRDNAWRQRRQIRRLQTLIGYDGQ